MTGGHSSEGQALWRQGVPYLPTTAYRFRQSYKLFPSSDRQRSSINYDPNGSIEPSLDVVGDRGRAIPRAVLI